MRATRRQLATLAVLALPFHTSALVPSRGDAETPIRTAPPRITDSQYVAIPPGEAEYVITIQVPPAPATHAVTFVFDGSVRSVLLENPHARVRAMVWADGRVDTLDLSRQRHTLWCRDAVHENIQALVLVLAHGERTQGTIGTEPVLRAYPGGCGRGWTGTTSQTITMELPQEGIVLREHVTAILHFAVDSARPHSRDPSKYWKSVGGQISWRISITGRCTGGTTGGQTIAPAAGKPAATLRLWKDWGRWRHSAAGRYPGSLPRYGVLCPDGVSEVAPLGLAAFFTSDVANDDVAPDGRSFGGHYTRILSPGHTVTQTYSFRCVIEC